jgi:drug/metabolite transporter (DMT)-like permease
MLVKRAGLATTGFVLDGWMPSGISPKDAPRLIGPVAALVAAVLFGASTPTAKLLLGGTDPWMLAALFYLGSGMGLLAIRLIGRTRASPGRGEAALSGTDWRWLFGAILFGGLIGPVLFMFGLSRLGAATASLLLNLESVLTALLAWFAFRENVDRRIAAGMLAIAAGAVALSWRGGAEGVDAWGVAAVVGACLAWAIDNNLTRKISLGDPMQIAMLKGLFAGTINLLLAFGHAARLPGVADIAGAGVVGLLGYGVSLSLYVVALRHTGAARTSAYYATAPFVGAVIAVVALGEPASRQLALAGVLMAAGVWLHLSERHEHMHEHEPLAHSHRHRHDEHHRHAHGPGDPPGEPHTHRHDHALLRHSHAHYPDAHHQHGH